MTAQSPPDAKERLRLGSIWQGLRWHTRRLSARLRPQRVGGSFIWEVKEGIRFVYTLDDAFSQLLYLHCAPEMVELDWCANWLDDCNTVIDCGANIGWFSAFLCQKLPSVRSVAIEGNEKTAWLCRLIMSQLDLSARVDVLNMVLTDNATARFVVLDRPGREPWQMAKQALASEEGPANSTLDQIIEDRDLMPDLVKIDCEGFEVRILRGATSVLARRHAALVIECNQQALREAGTSPRELFEILRGAGYACYHLASFTRQLPFGVAVDEEFQSPSYNFAAIPKLDRSRPNGTGSVSSTPTHPRHGIEKHD